MFPNTQTLRPIACLFSEVTLTQPISVLTRLLRGPDLSAHLHEVMQDYIALVEENMRWTVTMMNMVSPVGNTGLRPALNVHLFQTMCAYDVKIVLTDLLSTPPGWKRTLQARVLALLIYEFALAIPGLLGKDFRHSIETFLTTTEDSATFNKLCKDLSAFKRKEEKHLKEIRNFSIGHRGKDSRAQLELIQNLDVDHIATIATEVVRWQTRLLLFFSTYFSTLVNSLDGR
jgi:hypothetical protein